MGGREKTMTGEAAIRIIVQEYGIRYLYKRYDKADGDFKFRYRSYARGVTRELIRRIQESEGNDPIEVVKAFQKTMRDVLCENVRPNVNIFASYMLNITGEILDLLEIRRTEYEEA